MTEHTLSPQPGATPREEKLQAIAAVFGDAVAARLGHAQARDGGQTRPLPGAPDPDRVAWQTNRLIQHLRHRSAAAQTDPQAALAPARHTAPPIAPPRKPGPSTLPPLLAGEDLAAEHPAVIAHMLRHAPQHVRVAVLRALPGQLARTVMRRLQLG
jgi:hypothetical protein